MAEQLRLDVPVPHVPWRIPAVMIHAGKHWIPECRRVLTEVQEKA